MAKKDTDLPRPARGFCVKAELRMTPDKGTGVFAAEFIPANTKVYIITEDSKSFDERETLAHIASLSSEEEKKYWLRHVYPEKDKVVLDPYDLPMINHSHDPTMNMITLDYTDGYGYAIRDIKQHIEAHNFRVFRGLVWNREN